jgi:MFS family permease
MPAGSFVGALMVTQLADRLGRKRTVQLSGLIWVIGSILQCASIVRAPISAFHSVEWELSDNHL